MTTCAHCIHQDSPSSGDACWNCSVLGGTSDNFEKATAEPLRYVVSVTKTFDVKCGHPSQLGRLVKKACAPHLHLFGGGEASDGKMYSYEITERQATDSDVASVLCKDPTCGGG